MKKPRPIYPLVADTYDEVKQQVVRHYGNRRTTQKCHKCKQLRRMRWHMDFGQWQVVCPGCGHSRYHLRYDELRHYASPGSFAKWVFPVIRNISEVALIDQLVQVQPFCVANIYRLTGTRTGRMRGPAQQQQLPVPRTVSVDLGSTERTERTVTAFLMRRPTPP